MIKKKDSGWADEIRKLFPPGLMKIQDDRMEKMEW